MQILVNTVKFYIKNLTKKIERYFNRNRIKNSTADVLNRIFSNLALSLSKISILWEEI